MENNEEDLVKYRLSVIEKKLDKMTTLMENARDSSSNIARDIKELTKKSLELENAYNAHDKRLRELEEAPLKMKADRWQQIVDLVFKIAISTAVFGVFAKMGLQASGVN